MARKSRHSLSRKLRRKHTRRAHRRGKTHRRHRGGVAPVNYSLAGNWSSKMSLGQGGDYLKYHVGQHGGFLPGAAFPRAVVDSSLPSNLRGPAHVGGIDKAIADVHGFKDPNQAGGRRKHRKHHSRKHHSRKHHSRRHRKRRHGGSLGYAPFPSKGMLLDSQLDYARAALNPNWRDVEVMDANIREGQ
jgi:hypothetical protein